MRIKIKKNRQILLCTRGNGSNESKWNECAEYEVEGLANDIC